MIEFFEKMQALSKLAELKKEADHLTEKIDIILKTHPDGEKLIAKRQELGKEMKSIIETVEKRKDAKKTSFGFAFDPSKM